MGIGWTSDVLSFFRAELGNPSLPQPSSHPEILVKSKGIRALPKNSRNIQVKDVKYKSCLVKAVCIFLLVMILSLGIKKYVEQNRMIA